jgi:hypothetical protein
MDQTLHLVVHLQHQQALSTVAWMWEAQPHQDTRHSIHPVQAGVQAQGRVLLQVMYASSSHRVVVVMATRVGLSMLALHHLLLRQELQEQSKFAHFSSILSVNMGTVAGSHTIC